MSSFGIVNIGICVIEPFLPFIIPALSYIEAKSLYKYPGYPFLLGISLFRVDTSLKDSAYAVISVKTTNTCISKSNAKYSAHVSATFGVKILSTAGSFDKFWKVTTFESMPFSSKLFLKNSAVSYSAPISPKTTAKFSSSLIFACLIILSVKSL